MAAVWEHYLDERFPGYLLPSSERHKVTAEVARSFLEGLGLKARSLQNLRAISLIAAHTSELRDFASYWLPELARVLPCRARTTAKTWRGGYRGRLDVKNTLVKQLAGERDVFVTRSRHRDFSLPENVFVRTLADRTQEMLGNLVADGLLAGDGWAAGAVGALSNLRLVLTSTALRDVERASISTEHLQAALMARHRAYRVALTWYEVLVDALDRDDAEQLARTLSAGALRPMDAPKRFEVAVLMKLLGAIEARLPPTNGWRVKRGLIESGRTDIVTFERGEAQVSLYYDQAILPLGKARGPRDAGVNHYLGFVGRLRPDITLRVRRENGDETYTVFEIKLTEDAGYAATGFAEAIVYRHEYAEYLRGWPKAVLVTSRGTSGAPKREDEVVATNWEGLDSAYLLAGLLEGISVLV